MKTSRPLRLAALSGVAFFVLSLVGHFAISGEPDFMPKPSAARSFYVSHQNSILAGNTLFLFSAIALVIFGATLFNIIRGTGGSQAVAGVVLGAMVAAAALMFASASIDMAGAIHVQEKHTVLASEAVVFRDLSQILFGLAAPMALVAGVLGCAAASLRHRVLPVWLGALSIPMGIALAIPPINHVSMIVFSFWALVAGLVLTAWPAAGETPEVPRAAAVAG